MLAQADHENYSRTGNSFIIDFMLEYGYSKDECIRMFIILSLAYAFSANAYIECFKKFQVLHEFAEWVEQPGEWQKAKDELLEAIAIAVEKLQAPVEFQ